MATQADVRRIASELPGVSEEPGRFAFHVGAPGKQKHFVWVWLERVAPKKARVPNPGVIAIRVANELEKQALLSADETKFFTEPHYDGYPAVMVNLDQVTAAELEPLIREAWRCRAPKHLLDGTAAKQTTGTKRTSKPTSKRTSGTKRATGTKRASKPAAKRTTGTKRASKPAAKRSTGAKRASKPAANQTTGTKRASKPAAKRTRGTKRTSKPAPRRTT
jgi:hypothetical protein